MGHGRPIVLAGSLACTALLALAGPASAAGPKIVAPTDDGLVTGASVVVKVRASSTPHGNMNGHDISRLFTRSGGLWQAGVGLQNGLQAGDNTVEVTAGGGTDGVSFQLGRQNESVVAIGGVPSRARSGFPVKLTSQAQTFHARLNGHAVEGGLHTKGERRYGYLGADDGLRYGTNRITVSGRTADGHYDQDTQTFNVARNQTLAGASGPKVSEAGRLINLSGTKSLAPRGGKLVYRWTRVSSPPGSNARIQDPNSARPHFTPDVPGTYRVRLQVRERGKAANANAAQADDDSVDDSTVLPDADTSADVLDISVAPDTGAVGIPIHTCATQTCQLQVGDRPPIEAPRDKPILLATINRETGLPNPGPQFFGTDAGGLTGLKNAVNGLPPSTLAVVTVAASLSDAQIPAFNAAVLPLGGDEVAKGQSPFARFSVIGVKGWSKGTAWTNYGYVLGEPGRDTDPRGDIRGYFQVNPLSHLYTFARGDFPGFKTQDAHTANSNTMKFTGTSGLPVSYSATLPAGGTAGFHVIVTEADLVPIVDGNQAFAVNTNNGKDAEQQNAMIALLNKGNQAGRLTFIQSIGTPKVSAGNWQGITDVIKKLGGTDTAFNDLDGTRGYALVGGLQPSGTAPNVTPGIEAQESHQTQPASATGATGPTGTLSGVLARNRQSLLQPVIADPTGIDFNSGLLQLAYQRPTPWPERDTPGKIAALNYVSGELNPPLPSGDPRFSYTNRNLDKQWGGLQSQLNTIAYPDSGHGFSQADLRAVKRQLGLEFGDVATVAGLMDAIKSPLTDAGLASQGKLQSITDDILNISKVDRQSPLAGTLWEELGLGMDFFAGFSHSFGETPIGQRYEQLACLFIIVGIGVEDAQSAGQEPGEAVLEHIHSKAGQLAGTMADSYTKAVNALDLIRNLFVTDWGKLSTAANKSSTDPAWKADPASARAALLGGAKAWIYGKLLPIAFKAWNLGGVSAHDWYCLYKIPRDKSNHQKFTFRATQGSAVQTITTRVAPNGQREGNTLVLGRYDVLSSSVHRDNEPPPASMTDNIFGRIDPDDTTNVNKLGADKLTFFMENFDRPGTKVANRHSCPGPF
jgi:hypothetical protein